MSNDETTRIISRPSLVKSSVSDTDATAKINTNDTRRPAGSRQESSDDQTKIYRPSRPEQEQSGAASATGAKAQKDYAADPVVGWLVVVNGPGKGKSLTLGYGMNSIVRASSERVVLDFGDEEISRTAHAQLSYDGRGRKFYLQHGGGANLTYVGDIPVLQPAILTGGEIISIGNTKLRFCAFCDTNFDWQDQA